MIFEIDSKNLEEIEADYSIVFIKKGSKEHRWISHKDELELLKFEAEADEVANLFEKRRIYIATRSFDHEDIRLASAKAIKILKKLNIKTLKIGSYTGDAINFRAICEGMILGDYEFDRYKNKKNSKTIEKVIISLEEYDVGEIDKDSALASLKEGEIIANSINFTRDIVNTPPDDATPIKIAEIAQNLATSNNLECKIGDEKFLEEQKMGAFLAVSRASVHPPRFIHLTYKGENPKIKVALVGKGLTYDSGGLSLKPSEYMATMKADKGGACTVLGIIKAISELGLPIELHAIVGAAENMIGGNAYKPDDVLVAKNGKTIEVKNTDAEGRLVLADCLCYAQELNPDYIIDIATLTGACVVALGEYTFGIMGHSKELKNSMFEASNCSGELSNELHFNRYLEKLLKSEIADMSNISNTRYGGALSAGLFLSNFIEEKNRDRWLHLDIAGPAFVEKEWGYNPYGASGVGIRSVVEWLRVTI